ncbi:MAG TPA: Uma2 family endonuclease [Thermoanaerobaculia bacterium]|jgi:Uma2 family endonuclease
MATASLDTRRWTREEYERRVNEGYFQPGDRVELVDGVLYEMSPQNSLHAAGVRAANEALRPVFTEGYDIRSQFPLALGDDSEPEPDIAVVPGTWGDYIDSHPTTAVLVVEVADSSLYHDRKRKGRLYARAGIPEYWLLNLVKGCLQVYRNPKDGVYTTRFVLRAGDTVSPLARPEASIPVASLLPRR